MLKERDALVEIVLGLLLLLQVLLLGFWNDLVVLVLLLLLQFEFHFLLRVLFAKRLEGVFVAENGLREVQEIDLKLDVVVGRHPEETLCVLIASERERERERLEGGLDTSNRQNNRKGAVRERKRVTMRESA